jgi:hypothetical protein
MPPPTLDAVADELVKRISANDGAGVVALFAPNMAAGFPIEKTGPFVASIGRISSSERIDGGARNGEYRLAAERGEMRLSLHVDAQGKITGFTIKPPERTVPVAESTMPLGLPLRAPFTVHWGGDTPETNHHLRQKSQRRAADLCVTDDDGKTHRGDGKTNEDYFIYGRDVLAVADGVVTTVIDGLWDNEPGKVNPDSGFGNGVIVKHGDAIYSAYAHLQAGKIRVRVGSDVNRGAVLGLAGNSGNSSEPHLHFQIMDGPHFDSAWGMLPVFGDVLVTRGGNTTKVAKYTFLKGDVVRP